MKILEEIVEETSDDVKTPTLRQRIWQRLRPCWNWLFAVVILGLALGLAIGLTIGRNIQGPMDGTGIVALDLGDGSAHITLYIQDRSGQIRQAQYEDGIGQGNNIIRSRL